MLHSRPTFKPTPNPPTPSKSRSENFRNIALGFAGIISSILIPLLGLYYTSRDKEREVSKGFVDIATRILSDKPTKENKPLRQWAIALIDNYSTVKLPDEARQALLENQPIFASSGMTTSSDTLKALQFYGMTLGVSVSHFNAAPDFDLLKQHGIQFAFIKASQGASSVDAKGIENARAARGSGLKIGLYHFFEPDVDVAAQFANFSARLNSVDWDLPPTIDCENFPGKQIPADYADKVDQLAQELEKQFGRKPIIYTTTTFANLHFDQRESRYPLFVAQFSVPSVTGSSEAPRPRVPKWWSEYQFWHVAAGVVDDAVLRQYDIVAFKGTLADLAILSASSMQ